LRVDLRIEHPVRIPFYCCLLPEGMAGRPASHLLWQQVEPEIALANTKVT
jgi:hypothetical protein